MDLTATDGTLRTCPPLQETARKAQDHERPCGSQTEGTLRTDDRPSRGQPDQLFKIMSGLVGLKATEGTPRTEDRPSRGQPERLPKIMSGLVGLKATEGTLKIMMSGLVGPRLKSQ